MVLSNERGQNPASGICCRSRVVSVAGIKVMRIQNQQCKGHGPLTRPCALPICQLAPGLRHAMEVVHRQSGKLDRVPKEVKGTLLVTWEAHKDFE